MTHSSKCESLTPKIDILIIKDTNSLFKPFITMVYKLIFVVIAMATGQLFGVL